MEYVFFITTDLLQVHLQLWNMQTLLGNTPKAVSNKQLN